MIIDIDYVFALHRAMILMARGFAEVVFPHAHRFFFFFFFPFVVIASPSRQSRRIHTGYWRLRDVAALLSHHLYFSYVCQRHQLEALMLFR